MDGVRVGNREVKLTNLDKVFFPEPGLTKGDLIRYYLDVAPCVLRHVRNRPMQMKRYPNGVEGEFFYQKRVPVPHPDWLETTHIRFPSGRTADFPVCQDAASLAWIVNLGCIELHTWHSRITDVERPDYLLIDLDPSEGNPWEFVREIALVVKEVMDELGLHSFPKTSGATGLHILAPIKPELRFSAVRDLAKALAQEVVASRPRFASRPTGPACSSTTDRTRATGRSPARTRSARRRTPAPPRRCAGRRSARAIPRASRCRRCLPGWPRSAT